MFSVLQVIGDGRPGGGTTAVLGLAQGLAQRGTPVAIASDAKSYLIYESRKNNIPAIELDFSKRRNTAKITAALFRHLRCSPPTIVHAHGARAGLPVAFLPAILRTRTAYTVHGIHFDHKKVGVRHLAKIAERFCIRRTAFTVFVSKSDAKLASDRGLVSRLDSCRVIYCAIPHEGRLGESAPEFDIAYLGRLVPMKNVLLLPRILLALRPAKPTLHIIGGGESEHVLRRAIYAAGLAEQVTFAGELSHTEAMAYLKRARVMLLPSLWEGLPLSVVEAMHYGIPVVGSDVRGTNELIVDGQTGFLVPVNNVTGYAERVQQLLSDESLRRDIGERAVTRVRATFSMERQVAEHLNLYAYLAASKDARLGPRTNDDLMQLDCQ